MYRSLARDGRHLGPNDDGVGPAYPARACVRLLLLVAARAPAPRAHRGPTFSTAAEQLRPGEEALEDDGDDNGAADVLWRPGENA